MSNPRAKIWIVAFNVFYPLICFLIAFAIFFGISWLLAVYAFATQPMPFWFFALAGLVLGAALVVVNLRRTWPALVQLFRRGRSEGST